MGTVEYLILFAVLVVAQCSHEYHEDQAPHHEPKSSSEPGLYHPSKKSDHQFEHPTGPPETDDSHKYLSETEEDDSSQNYELYKPIFTYGPFAPSEEDSKYIPHSDIYSKYINPKHSSNSESKYESKDEDDYHFTKDWKKTEDVPRYGFSRHNDRESDHKHNGNADIGELSNVKHSSPHEDDSSKTYSHSKSESKTNKYDDDNHKSYPKHSEGHLHHHPEHSSYYDRHHPRHENHHDNHHYPNQGSLHENYHHPEDKENGSHHESYHHPEHKEHGSHLESYYHPEHKEHGSHYESFQNPEHKEHGSHHESYHSPEHKEHRSHHESYHHPEHKEHGTHHESYHRLGHKEEHENHHYPGHKEEKKKYHSPGHKEVHSKHHLLYQHGSDKGAQSFPLHDSEKLIKELRKVKYPHISSGLENILKYSRHHGKHSHAPKIEEFIKGPQLDSYKHSHKLNNEKYHHKEHKHLPEKKVRNFLREYPRINKYHRRHQFRPFWHHKPGFNFGGHSYGWMYRPKTDFYQQLRKDLNIKMRLLKEHEEKLAALQRSHLEKYRAMFKPHHSKNFLNNELLKHMIPDFGYKYYSYPKNYDKKHGHLDSAHTHYPKYDDNSKEPEHSSHEPEHHHHYEGPPSIHDSTNEEPKHYKPDSYPHKDDY